MYTLYIGNKNYSSWSLRAWVLMKAFGIPFNEQRITLYEPDSPNGSASIRLRAGCPACTTAARSSGIRWRSPSTWPNGIPACGPLTAGARAWARSAAAEMHSGYSELRNEFGMNLRIREKRKASPAAESDIARIAALWREGRERFGRGGDFLCGAFGVVDAFYCPVAFRFDSYGVALDDVSAAYHGRCSRCRRCANGPKARARDRAYRHARPRQWRRRSSNDSAERRMSDLLAAWRDRVRAATAATTPLRIVGGGSMDFYGQRLAGRDLRGLGRTPASSTTIRPSW